MVELWIAANGAFDHRAAMETLASHRIEGLERCDAERGAYARLVEVAGQAMPIEVVLAPNGVQLYANTADDELVARVRHLFDLDTDIGAVDQRLELDEVLGPLVRTAPGVRITRYADTFEAVSLTVLGQQVSLAAARLFGSRLVAAYGREGPAGLRVFPAPQRIAAEPGGRLRSTLGLTNARTKTLQAVARFFADAPLDHATEPGLARERLQKLPGIGPWTLGYLAIRAFTDPDAFPASDAVLKRALTGLGVSDPRTLPERWAPYRSYAAVRLWRCARAGRNPGA